MMKHCCYMSSDNEFGTSSEDEVVELVVRYVVEQNIGNCIPKQPYRTDSLTGKQYVYNILNGNVNRCPEILRLEVDVLYDLCDILRYRVFLRDTRNVAVEEQVCILLYTIGHNECNRLVADRFQHSNETISRHFKTVLKAICRFSKEVIRSPNFDVIHPYIMSRRDKYYPWFKDCVGAIDGTHISASVPSGASQIPYRGRNTLPTQNVMCVCDFDMCFTYVLAGWEGTANDARIFMEAVSDPQSKFPHPPTGKYYVVDSGYSNMLGYLAPYRGQRYHLNDYPGTRLPLSAREKFNHSHSSLRNIIERCFGVLKARFPILKMMPSYSLRKQRNIVIASCAIHNFIRRHAMEDDLFLEYEIDDMIVPGEGPSDPSETTTYANLSASESQKRRHEMYSYRDGIRTGMSLHYRLPM
ncbi:uncharacterized protein LOC113279968 [Papaver somniferum]|uniref:uncharacterized protein LOC113279968 n=1 Tax=Papaver somniferum TaxID=3469 RepID=UPI000E703DA9|nr:uncharacterized protein LOC113279968 [Papaver somniferum]